MTVLLLSTGAADLERGVLERPGGVCTPLTPQDCRLLAWLSERPQQDIPREVLLVEVMGYQPGVVSRAVDDAIKRLRAKVEQLPARPFHIVGVRGVGYRFVPLDTSSGLGVLQVGAREVDLERLEVRNDGDVQPLSALDGRLLEVLALHRGRPVHPETLLREVWRIYDRRRRRLVDKAVYRLRRKLEDDPRKPRVLRTVRGRGLLLEVSQRLARPVLRPGRSGIPKVELVGRTALVRRVDKLLGEGGARVTLHGPGGIGKTTLASHVASRREGPSVWVDLHDAHQVEELVRRTAAALGVDSTDQARIIASLEVQPDLLLVLDNADTASDLLGALIDQLQHTRVLVTSRTKVGCAGEQVVPVGPLKPAEGRRLVVQRAASAAIGLELHPDADEVGVLVDRLEGVPLALELAAARLSDLGLAGVLDHLAQPLELLAGGTGARHPTLRAAIELSTDRLDANTRRVLAAVAVLPGPCSLDALVAGCAPLLDRSEVEAGVSVLLDHALLRWEGPAWLRLGLAVADVVLEWPEATSDQNSVRSAHLDWAAALWSPRGDLRVPTPGEVVWLRGELEGALSALRWGLRHGRRAASAKVAVWLSVTLLHTGRASEAESVLRGVGTAQGLPTELSCDLRSVAVEVFSHTLDIRATRRWLEVLAEVAPAGSASACRVLAGRLVLMTRLKEADRAGLSERVDAAIASEQGVGLARLLRARAWVRSRRGDASGARADLLAALREAEGADWAWECSIICKFLATLCDHAGEHEAAEAWLVQRWAHLAPAVPREEDGDGLVVLARIRLGQGRLVESVELLQDQLLRARTQGHRGNVTHQLGALGNTFAIGGRLEEALTAWKEALRHARALGSRELVGSLTYNIAEVSWWRGDAEAALSGLAKARQVFEETGQSLYDAFAQVTMARILLRLDRVEEAEMLVSTSLSVLEPWGRPQGLAEALLVRAELWARRGVAGAEALGDRALALGRQGSTAGDLVAVLAMRGEVALHMGDEEQAWDLCSEAQDHIERLGLAEGAGPVLAARRLQRLLEDAP